ncbi:M48 family metalloprotease [uncultured Oxalicibacterium sp.]|uniref:M48 family metalloprotease n=1 Tax=uncultured Oxalicibacterium sp. TaxID=1168540 RepID=UPI0025F446A9|nr:M48 family metalloprotease [uncultured Oxalicibacterium sp.]
MQDLPESVLSQSQGAPSRPARLLKQACVPLAALVLAACSTVPLDSPRSGPTPVTEAPQLQALRSITAQQDRLYNISAPLLVDNAALCKSSARKLIGFTAKNRYSYSEDYVDAATALGLEERLQVTGVLRNSGAARAGIMRGDVLTAIENQPLPQGPNAERQAAAQLGPVVSKLSTVKISVSRKGSPLTLSVPLTAACGFGIELGNVDNVNAYADGRRVLVTRGMLNFARNDTEVAYVLARELAHNALGHPTRQQMNATVGAIIDNMTRVNPDVSELSGMSGIKPMPQDMDVAADTVALYMLARAGYSIDGAASFWQRLATQYPASVVNGYTAIHPSTSARINTIQKITSEIKAKQAAKKALFP